MLKFYLKLKKIVCLNKPFHKKKAWLKSMSKNMFPHVN